MASIASWIYDKPLRGNYTFTHDEVAQAFPDMSAGSIARALTREVSKGRIMSPLRGFYVIVPDEYVLRGAVPQSFYLDDMMLHLGRKYYVALLSAASYHGASHQVTRRERNTLRIISAKVIFLRHTWRDGRRGRATLTCRALN